MIETKYASPGNLAALLSTASVEVSSRGHQLAELRDHFSPGINVTITFLPGDDYRHNVETAAALRRLGFNPVLHVAAREMRLVTRSMTFWRGRAARQRRTGFW
jgi:methylenetetrahydrofolate reductase (NADPH)